MNRFPAMVLPAARAMRASVLGWTSMGWKRATRGTLETSWLMTTLKARMAGTVARSEWGPARRD